MDIQEYLNNQMNPQELAEMVHKQHYAFCHVLMPHIVENYFEDLVNKIIDESAQSWILELWNNSFDNSIPEYTQVIYPKCNFVKTTDGIGLIYFIMPAPRVSPESAYTVVVFSIDDDSPSNWLRSYFTLELGIAISPYWILGEWNNSEHINRGEFELEPTIENFLATVVAEAKNRWH
jgi:hypothetical protein